MPLRVTYHLAWSSRLAPATAPASFVTRYFEMQLGDFATLDLLDRPEVVA